MNIYQLRFGYMEYFVAAESMEEAYNIGTDPEKFPDIHFLPFEIKQVEVPGYDISVTAIPSEQVEMDAEETKVLKRTRKAQ